MATALPENRVYEMVSPVEKNGGDVGMGGTLGYFRSSDSGDQVAYSALGGFGNPQSNAIAGTYAAERGEESWASTPMVVPMGGALTVEGNWVQAISPDFTKAIAMTNIDLDTGEPGQGIAPELAYLYEPATGETELFTVPDQSGNKQWRVDFHAIGGNADFSRIVFGTGADLLGDGLGASANRVYLRTEKGPAEDEIELASRLPNGDPTVGYFPRASSAFALDTQVIRPVSDDADVAYFTTGPNNTGPLYRRDLVAEETVLVNADENPSVDLPLGEARFAGASVNGQIAYFSSTQQLVAEDTNTVRDLYQYDHSKSPGSRLTMATEDANLTTGEEVENTYGVSLDGETIVIAALRTGNLNRFYVYRDGELLDTGMQYTNTSVSGIDVDSRAAKLSDDGETFAFITRATGITVDDNGGHSQLYVYDVSGGDADTPGEVDCASCLPDGGVNTADASFYDHINIGSRPFTSSYVPAGHQVSDEGHAFFYTADRLVPEDTNGKLDVYVWKDGDVDLISSGRSTDQSYFADASADGSTVFFVTREQLSGWDVDSRLDLYAAKIDGGLPEPDPPVPACQGQDCQGSPPVAPTFTAPESDGANGRGNPEPRAEGCTSLKKKAKRLDGKAKRLKRKAKRSGKGSAQKAKRAKAAKRKARGSKRQLRRCRQGHGS